MSSILIVRIATRTSKLALRQVDEIISYINKKLRINIKYDIIGTKTLGDRIRSKDIRELKSHGVFSSEVNKRVIDGEADLAVHSLKDLTSRLPEGLQILTVSPRRDPRDSLVPRKDVGLWPGPGAVIAAGSPRRRAFTKLFFNKKINIIKIRGNIDTRLRKLDAGYATHAIIAEAAIERLDVKRERLQLPLVPFTPAPGQGYIAVVGFPDTSLGRLILESYSEHDRLIVEAERAFLREVGGTCGKPVGGIVVEAESGARGFLAGAVGSRGHRWVFIRVDSSDLVDAARQAAREVLRVHPDEWQG